MKIVGKVIIALLVCSGILLISSQDLFAQSAATISGSIDDLQNSTSELWRAQVFSLATNLFLACVGLDIIFWGYRIMFQDAPFTFVMAIKQVGIYLLFFSALYFFDSFDDILYGFIQIAQFITGQPGYSEGAIIARGLDFFLEIQEHSWESGTSSLLMGALNFFRGDGGLRGLGIFLFGFTSSVFIVIGFFIIAVQYAYISIKTTIIITVGPLFLGFLPLKVIRETGERYLSTVLSLAIELFFFYIALAFGMTAIDAAMIDMKNTALTDFYSVWTLLFLCYMTVTLLAKLPSQLSGFITQNMNISLEKLLPER